jgi:hypothetical protein
VIFIPSFAEAFFSITGQQHPVNLQWIQRLCGFTARFPQACYVARLAMYCTLVKIPVEAAALYISGFKLLRRVQMRFAYYRTHRIPSLRPCPAPLNCGIWFITPSMSNTNNMY